MSPRKRSPQETDAPTDEKRDELESDGDQEREAEHERGVVSSPDSSDQRGKSDVEREGAVPDTSGGDDEVTWPGRGAR